MVYAAPVTIGAVHFARFESVLIMAITAPPSPEIIARLGRELSELTPLHPAGVSVVIVREIPAGTRATGVDDATRREARALVDQMKDRVIGFAYVFPQQGFAAAVIRMFLNGLTRAVPFPARLFVEPAAAIDWLTALDGQPADLRRRRAELTEAMAKARAQLAA